MSSEPPAPPRLTRELLLGGGLADMITRASPGMRVLTEAERRTSLHAALAARAEHGHGVWLFAYGSLIWNPTIRITAQRPAVVRGWHRAFCLATRAGRGTPENPGLLLGLRPGGECRGAVLRVPEEGLEHELDVLWRREMVTGSYTPRWLAATDEAGANLGQALAFTIDDTSHSYAGDLPETDVVERLATAGGELGTCAEYLFRTCEGLHRMGIRDAALERIATLVAARQAARAAVQAAPAT
ncbi:MAG: gamma-glutamylcyclotransferase [Rhodospirillales bacterium]|nr:gamma-glutamylcyclotransferase [Rhodospirillales bacterium]